MNTLEKAIATYGADLQLTVAVEEFSKLIKEICKHKRGSNNRVNIIEEMSDCYIMLEQIRLIFEIDSDEVMNVMNDKIDRLEKRLERSEE